MPNSTMVIEFLLTRFSDVWELRILHSMLFQLMYLATIMGNLLIVTVTTVNQSLHIPMYFFLRNLSVLDRCYISVTGPKTCVIFLLDNQVISMVGCEAQIFLVIFFAFAELMFLTIMAHDHYVVIGQPFHYSMIMNPRFCVQVTLASVFCGVIYSGFHTGNTFWLHFCWSNVVHQFFCDIPRLMNLSCSDTLNNEIIIFVSGVVVLVCSFAFITRSYIYMFSTVLKFPTRKEHRKAFASCVPHILMVTIFVTSVTAGYMKPTSHSPTILDKITSFFSSTVTPFLNPIIYSLRNKQIKEAVRRITRRKLYSGKC